MKKYIFLIACILPLMVSAQRGKGKGADRMANKRQMEKNLKYYNEIFGTADKDFDISTAPADWKEEPIVMLCQKIHISFLRNTKTESNQTKGVVRKRLLIQDKAALEDFSEFYYQTSDAIGINLIKPDGSVNKIDLADAIKVETDIPSFYADSYHSDDYYKIAIPNLEVGDILDFFKVFKETYQSNIELIAPVNYGYPVVHQEIIFDVDKLWTFYYNSFNNAPKFKEDPEGGIDNNGRRRKLVKRFVMTNKMLPAQDDERWNYTYLTEPILKVMAVPPNGTYADKRDPIKKNIDLKKAFSNTGSVSNSFIVDMVKTRLNGLKIKSKSKKEKIDLIYRSLRIDFLNQANAGPYGVPTNNDISQSYYSMKSNIFSAVFAELLKKNDIECEQVMIVPRYFGSRKTVVTSDELEYGVYIPATKKYYWTVNNFQVPGENNSRVFSAAGYKAPSSELRKKSPNFKTITVPASSHKDNVMTTKMDITINSDNSMNFKNSAIYQGAFKSRYSSLFLYSSDVYTEEIKALSSERMRKKIEEAENAGKSRNRRAREAHEKAEAQKKEIEERKKEVIEDWVKEDYEVEEFKDYKLVSSGINIDEPVLQLDFDFTSKDYLKKAGPNYIIELGRLIGSQVSLDEEEIKERKKPVDIEYAKSIVNEFNITLPAGLKAQGLDAFNMNVDNEQGAFISTVSQEGNTLKVKTTKIYKMETVPVANWNGMVEMLEAAYKFSQLKMVLKKG